MDKIKVVAPLSLIFSAIILQRVTGEAAAEIRPKVVGGEFLGEAILQKLGEFQIS
jgi:hypothetical protein